MRLRLFPLLAVCLVCLFSARAQTVVESESRIVFNEKTAEVSIVLDNPNKTFDGRIHLELLDAAGTVRASGAQDLKIKKGRHIYPVALTTDDAVTNAGDEILWYRLRYRLGPGEGIISLSELIKDTFELRIAAAENVLAGTNYRVRVRALQPMTRRPVQNVKIDVELVLELNTDDDEDELTLKAGGETNGDGFAFLDFKIAEALRLDGARLRVVGRKSGVTRVFSEDYLESDGRESSIFLTADKPLYQPGQAFNVRALYFDQNNFVVPEGELEFTVKDEEGTVLYREEVKTSAFGIASISWKIPDNAKLGTYTVEVETDEDVHGSELSFKVSRYDLPQFTVTAKPDRTFYLPGDKTAEITVKADYLFGQPVTKGSVRVVQESERRWNWRKQQYDVDEKSVYVGATDAEGKYLARVDLSEEIEDLQSSGWRRYVDLQFAAYFTDASTNRTEQRRFDIRLSKEPIHIYLIGDRYELSQHLPIRGYISTFYADGTPAVCDVEIKGRKYQEGAAFSTMQRLKTNSLGAGKVRFSRPKDWDMSDDLDLLITARDAQGRTGTFTENIYYYSEMQGLQIETDQAVYKPGQSVKINLISSVSDALVYVDIVRDWSVIETRFVRLNNGKGELKIPYNPNFRGELTVAAYIDSNRENTYYRHYDLIKDSRGIIFPEQQNLRLDAQFSAASYKPNDEAQVTFSVFDGRGRPAESALGVVVFDRAIEERARTDAEFGSFFSRFSGFLGYSRSFGGITLRHLNELNLSKPISPELQLAAEAMLSGNHYYPRIYRSSESGSDAASVYADYFKKQMTPVEEALKSQFEKNFVHPTDAASLRVVLSDNGLNFDALRDPWGNAYQAVFTVEKTQDVLRIKTAGADKKLDTKDDFIVASMSFAYFTPVGKAFDRAVGDYHRRTGGYIRDLLTLSAELEKQDVDLKALRDRFGRDYRITFEVSGRNYLIRIKSLGANGYYEPTYWNSDDFDVWVSQIDYFAPTERQINDALNRTVNDGKAEFPETEEGFRQILKAGGVDLEGIRDGYGESAYLSMHRSYRYADKTTVEDGKQVITPVTEEVVVFAIRSRGSDRLNSGDDFDLMTVSGTLSEQSKDTKYEKSKVKTIAYTGASGAIRGTVTDALGAAVPGATVTATNVNDAAKTFSTMTKDTGEFLLENLPSGAYNVRVDASGFKSAVYTNIQVRSQSLVEIKAALEAGAIQETVEITAEAAEVNASVSLSQVESLPLNAGKAMSLVALKPGVKGKSGDNSVTEIEETSTPRLREYFPETLVWQPELLTDEKGKAELKFRMADNITTWKLYTIASTKNGKIGVAEKEVQSFQQFFVDLEPPKFLTEGDEIHLPTQIRNYTRARQKVNVTMAPGDWFSFLGSANQQIDVDSGASENAVFGFKAVSVVKNGRQRVTAVAPKDSDAIEKPVTVRPNGQEVVRTESKLFRRTETFEVNFPTAALPGTPRAEVKIYPNLLAHVAESVEGLLQRPYGCGEQTVSSTYPNLMILRFTEEGSALRAKAQKFLGQGYERLLGYQTADGGFSYWGGKEAADLALTAHALRFLHDARESINVDPAVIERAEKWLVSQQKADGSWTRKYYWESAEDVNRTKLLTSYVARTLAIIRAAAGASGEHGTDAALHKALGYLKARTAEIDEPYAMALLGLASLDTGNLKDAAAMAERLEKMAVDEAGAAYWQLETNTPFYGWGTAGRIETTALVLQFLIREAQAQKSESAARKNLISKGSLFLLKNKDRYGVWYSTQTTINVLDAFLAALAGSGGGSQEVRIALNGGVLQEVKIAPDQITPVVLDLSGKINSSVNRIEVSSPNNSTLMSQVVASHYVDWRDADVSNRNTNESRQIRLDYRCDRLSAEIMQDVTCSVEAERVGFRGYGMLLAEIGLPPGADVSRESLQKAMDADWSLSRYDVLPDRIVVYMWARGGGTKFSFRFRPRYGISAQTPASVVYDYYNPEAQAVIAPLKFSVK